MDWRLGVLPRSSSGPAAPAEGGGAAGRGGGRGGGAAPGNAALYRLLGKLYCTARAELLRLGEAAGLQVPKPATAAASGTAQLADQTPTLSVEKQQQQLPQKKPSSPPPPPLPPLLAAASSISDMMMTQVDLGLGSARGDGAGDGSGGGARVGSETPPQQVQPPAAAATAALRMESAEGSSAIDAAANELQRISLGAAGTSGADAGKQSSIAACTCIAIWWLVCRTASAWVPRMHQCINITLTTAHAPPDHWL